MSPETIKRVLAGAIADALVQLNEPSLLGVVFLPMLDCPGKEGEAVITSAAFVGNSWLSAADAFDFARVNMVRNFDSEVVVELMGGGS